MVASPRSARKTVCLDVLALAAACRSVHFLDARNFFSVLPKSMVQLYPKRVGLSRAE
jgi:hypothetical protein